MPLSASIRTVESHTEGMPTRIVVDGAPSIAGDSMRERRIWAAENLNGFRNMLMREPRGHPAMFGAVLLPATRPDADFGVLFMSASGFLPMCGHATMGVATVVVEEGMVEATEPVTEVRLEVPTGLAVAKVSVLAGKVGPVTITGVRSFVTVREAVIEVADIGSVAVDVAYGGNFYAIVDTARLGVPLEFDHRERLTSIGLAVLDAVRAQLPIEHPTDPAVGELKAVLLARAAGTAGPARNMVVKEPRYFDRSPCGTGTSARMALLHSRGELSLDEPFMHESLLGTRFQGRLVGTTQVGPIPAVIPEITGRAWITGSAEYTLDPDDPFPAGFAT